MLSGRKGMRAAGLIFSPFRSPASRTRSLIPSARPQRQKYLLAPRQFEGFAAIVGMRARYAIRQGASRAVSPRQGHSDNQGRGLVVGELHCARSIVGKSRNRLDILADTEFTALGAISNGDKGKRKGSVLHTARGQTRRIHLCSAYGVFAE